jgi:hypothetical protein
MADYIRPTLANPLTGLARGKFPKVLTSTPDDFGSEKPTLYRHPTAKHDSIQNSARRKPIGSTATLAVLKFGGHGREAREERERRRRITRA